MTVINDIRNEVNNQTEKWGKQSHHPEKWMNILMKEVGEASEAVLEAYPFKIKLKTKLYWLRKYRQELVQVAAVAYSAIKSLDENELKVGGNVF